MFFSPKAVLEFFKLFYLNFKLKYDFRLKITSCYLESLTRYIMGPSKILLYLVEMSIKEPTDSSSY